MSGRIRLAEIRLRLDYAPGRSAFAADRYQCAAYQFPRYAQRVYNVEFPFQFFRGRILLLQYPMIPSVDKSTQALKACFGTLLRSRRLYYIQ